MIKELKPQDAQNLLIHCQKDPIFFSKHVLCGEQPWKKQKEIMFSVRDNRRTIVPSGFSVGKTWVAARTALWFLYSFPHSLVITTAPTWRQVENVLWAEIRRQYYDSKLSLGGDLLQTQIKIADDWFALGLSTDEPTHFQGFHSASLLLVFDEAAGIDRAIWDIAEGQMAGAFARWLAIGNPIAPSGPFYDACNSPGWNTIAISCLDSPNLKAKAIIYPKLVTEQWVDDRRTEWGQDSPMFQSKVLGRFPQASEFGLIPLDWLIASHKRAKNQPEADSDDKRIGVDIARSGADRTVFLYRQGSVVKDIEDYHNLNTMEIVGRLIRFVEKYQVPWRDVMVDAIGIGAGVVDRLREQGYAVCEVNFSATATNKVDFTNIRAESYWKVREALSPEAKNPLAIPARFSRLASELTAIEWSVCSTGKTQLESKEDIKKRLGHSPDHADALALAYSTTLSRFLAKIFHGYVGGRFLV